MKKFKFTCKQINKYNIIAEDFEEALKIFKKEISDDTGVILDISIEEELRLSKEEK